jgi:AbrB family looped-hinge helix DNA binding protein
MLNTHISTKGQVIIPKSMRDANHWVAGTELVAEQTPLGILLRPASTPKKRPLLATLRAIQERIGYTGPPVTVEQMNQAVLDEAARRGSR